MDLIALADFASGETIALSTMTNTSPPRVVSWLGLSLTGAMENWGLVTYRETALLVDPLNSSSSSKQWVALVVGHELAHQWFGNLVTMVRSRISVPLSSPSLW